MAYILLREYLTSPIQIIIYPCNESKMMYNHMALSPMDWSSLTLLGTILSLALFYSLYYLLPINNCCMSRWDSLLNKMNGTSLSIKNKSYLIVTCMSIIVFFNNLYSIYSFNWMPSTQSWIMLLFTTMFLSSIWIHMVMTGGMKLFGQKIPISWYLINLCLWLFHNLSFIIRFISLPFRMMMNLMVGCFLVEFGKSSFSTNSLISMYEMFVITVQTLVFILLMNMYYSEMMMMPEWKHISPRYQFLRMKPTIHLLKTKIISFMHSLPLPKHAYEKISYSL
uniref:ATP synthase F0 subunit 6 n=1 Tax=Trichuris sp. TMM5 TaxID=2810713 RepID=A0A891GQ14_9BILA|nr:ATP synthase F0 subunit 6 [Trichuris sp. TMM5]